jgi:uncharacterized repeat protein (TIGR01451 family)
LLARLARGGRFGDHYRIQPGDDPGQRLSVAAESNGQRNSGWPAAQLSVVKSPKGGTFTMGAPVSFTIVVSNPAIAGSQAATNVTLSDALPTNGGLTWTAATATQGSCQVANNVLNCSLGTIPAQASATIIVSSPATTPVSACTAQSNPFANAAADGGLAATDSGSLNCTPPPAQLGVVKSPKGGTFTMGAPVSFTIVVSNPAIAGSQAATNVKLSDVLPTNGGLTWTAATATQGSCQVANNALNCSLGTIPAQASATIIVSSPAATPVSACTAQSNPFANAAADGGLAATDSGSLTCTPPPPAQLSVVKGPKGGTFAMGGPVSFTIVVSNPAGAGSQAATNVKLNDTLPVNGGLTWTSATTTQGACGISGNLLSCSLGSLAAGTSATVVVSNPATPAGACTAQPNPGATATADGGLSVTDTGSLTCTPPPVTATCVSIVAIAGTPITPVIMTASGGVGGYTFSASGLPTGLTMSTSGTISGTPSVFGIFSYTVTVRDSNGNTGTTNCSVTVQAGGIIAPLSLACGNSSVSVGGAYSSSLVANGGVSPYTFSIAGGAMPATFSLNGSTGAITGTAGTAGTYTFTAQVVDSSFSSAATQTASCSITIGATSSVTTGDAATIGFWHNKNGQALINALNGGATSKALANWLAGSFPYLYGANSTHNLTNRTNADVAALFMTLFNGGAPKTDAQVMAGALAVYVTSSSLAGTTAAQYGFNSSTAGTGAKTYNVGTSGAAMGLVNNQSYTVLQLLQQADFTRQNGTYDGNSFNVVFNGINITGDII